MFSVKSKKIALTLTFDYLLLILVQTTKETEEMIVVVNKESVEAEKTRKVVQAEEHVAQGKADESKAIKVRKQPINTHKTTY